MLVSEFLFQAIYFRIVFILAILLDIIFWLAAWAWAASVAADALDYNDLFGVSTELEKYGRSMAAGAALGAINW